MVIYLLLALLIASTSSQACGTVPSVVASMANIGANTSPRVGGHVHRHVIGQDGIIGMCAVGNTCFLNWASAQAVSRGCVSECANGGGEDVVCNMNVNIMARDANGVQRVATGARFIYRYRTYQGQVVGWVAHTGYPTVFAYNVPESAETEGEPDADSNQSVPEEPIANTKAQPHRQL